MHLLSVGHRIGIQVAFLGYLILSSYSIVLFTLVDYLDELMQETILQCENSTSQLSQTIPEPLCSAYERPDKAAAVSRHCSRFNIQ